MAKLKPNEKCHCGSGKKYKKCCMRRDKYGFDERDLLDPGPVPQEVCDETDRWMAEIGYTKEVAEKLYAIEQEKRRRQSRRISPNTMAALSLLAGFARPGGGPPRLS